MPPPQHVYSELYNSDAFLLEHNKIQAEHCNDEPALENVVATLMPYSDSTHLTNFGTASLWPIYLFFSNISKYIRAKLTSFSANHLAYIPSVSVSFTYGQLRNSLYLSYPIPYKTHTGLYLGKVPLPLYSHSSSGISRMRSGSSCLIQSSCMHMSMGSSSGFGMVS
jgi:hypothetical protein